MTTHASCVHLTYWSGYQRHSDNLITFFGIEFFIKNGQCTPHVILGRSLIQILQSKNFIPILVENSYITQSCLMVHAPQRVAYGISLPCFDRHSCSLSISRNSSASASITFLMLDIPTCTCTCCLYCLTQISDHRHLSFSSHPPGGGCPGGHTCLPLSSHTWARRSGGCSGEVALVLHAELPAQF